MIDMLAPTKMIQNFFRLGAAGGLLLGISAILALILKNSPLESLYDGFLTTQVVVQVGALAIDKPLLLWINDGMMAIFFLLIGLEVKREILDGQLSNKEQVTLPAIAAFGGLICPALIFSYLNWNDPEALTGWAIPAATDIAFALGVVALLGPRVPASLKACLLAIAIFDDLAAIVIIALFYTQDLSLYALTFSIPALIGLLILNRRGVTNITPYIALGAVLWVCVLKSGVHATLAGVIVAFAIPLKGKGKNTRSPLRELEHDLHHAVAFGILPLFAFANGGVSLRGLSLDYLLHPVTLGIAAGLFIGKQIGIMSFSYLSIIMGLCKLPKGVNWKQFYGLSLVCGIGFTMSLFIGSLAYAEPEHLQTKRLGILLGSLLSGGAGYLVLRLSCRKRAVA